MKVPRLPATSTCPWCERRSLPWWADLLIWAGSGAAAGAIALLVLYGFRPVLL